LAALGFSLTVNHPFIDGNKRVAHAAMEVYLVLNGFELTAPIDEQERLMLDLADGKVTREQLSTGSESA
jgi:death-on-curing protein